MSKTARTVWVFGIYLILLGMILMAFPNVLLSLFQMPAAQEVWIRVSGMLVLYIGAYYFLAARSELTPFFQWTVYLRATVILFFIAFVVLGFGEWPLILFGGLDLLGAAWTEWEIRRQKTGALAAA